MKPFDFLTRRTSAAPSSHPRKADIPLSFLGAVLDSSDDAIVGVAHDGNVVAWNGAATRLFGYDSAEIVGHPASLLVAAGDRPEADALFASVARGERVDHRHAVRSTKDGRAIRVALTIVPVRDGDGTIVASAMTVLDLAEQERSELASARLAAIVESSDDAVVSKDLNGIVKTWNAGAQRIFGYTPEEIVGHSIMMIIPPELQDEERVILGRISAGERIEHFDTVRIARDGHRIPISLTVSPIRDARGKVIGASKVARDISERRRAEQDAEDSRRRLARDASALRRLGEASTRLWRSRTLASALDEILRTVRDITGAEKGNVQLLNPATGMLTIVGSEGFGPDFLATFEQVPASDPRPACGRALTAGRTVVIEDVLADADYAPFHDVARAAGYHAVTAVPLFAADRSPLGAISVHFPSAHRPTEGELRRLQLYCRQASDFIQRIGLEQALREREEALNEADRRKNEFLAMLAHELRNPLAPIRYALGAIRKAGISLDQRTQAHDVLERQVGQMSRLLDDLLDISRITRGVLELKRSATTLSAVVETSVEAAQPYLDAKRHALSVTLPDHPVRLVADPVRLAQVFSNLLINAAKYTPEGGHVSLAATNGHDSLVVAVRDDGVGIAADLMPRLFTFFTQGPATIGDSASGLGVGLAMVRGLVELHHGSVEAHSAGPGRGSEFIVRLPIDRAGVEAPDLPPRPAAPRRPLRILVVDDNRDAADSCVTLLELSGHRAAVAYDGLQALAVGDTFVPHVALLDLGMPDLDGFEVARRIRKTAWGAGIPLVAVTGWGKEEDRRRALAAGFDRHVTKPVAPEAIESLVDALADEATEAAH